MYWNFDWSCSCAHFTQIHLQKNAQCWHIEWVLKKIEAEMIHLKDNSGIAPVFNDRAQNESTLNNNNSDSGGAININNNSEINSNSENRGSAYKKLLSVINEAASSGQTSKRVTRSAVKLIIIQSNSGKPNSKDIQTVVEENEWEVETVLGRRINAERNILEYFIKWKGWDKKWNSWVLINDLHCDLLIEEYERRKEEGDDNLISTASKWFFCTYN